MTKQRREQARQRARTLWANPEFRQAMTEGRRGANNPMFGRTLTKSHRQKISAALQGRPAHNKGKPHTDTQRAKISAALKGKLPKNFAAFQEAARRSVIGSHHTQEWKEEMSRRMKGRPSPAKGKHWAVSAETRRRVSESKKGAKNGAWKDVHRTLTCLVCSTEFTAREKEIEQGRRFCSRSCGSRHRKGELSPAWRGGQNRKASKKRYLQEHREQVYFNNRLRRIRKRNAEGTHTFQQWQELKARYDFMCLCCKRREPEIKLTEDHIIPLVNGGSNFIENIQPLCNECNIRKFTKTIDYRKELANQLLD